jgi:Na+-driven multidrug efflux pump
MMEWGVAIGLAFGVILIVSRPWLVSLFTDDPGVRHLAEQLIVVLAVLQPLNAVVFVLDGVLIGAGDQRFLAIAMVIATFAVYAPVAWLVTAAGGGVVALWGAIAVWLVARAFGLVGRYVGPKWQVTGAVAP